MKDDPLKLMGYRRGSQLPWAKLDEDDVREIRKQIARREELRAELAKLTNAAIAHRVGVHRRTIDKLSDGTTWGHV